MAHPHFLHPVKLPDANVGQAARFGADTPLELDCGRTLSSWTIAYTTYGALNADHSNAILVCHALTGDQFVASEHPLTGKPGWWEVMIGPEKPIDTNRFFVICTNVLGGCMGSSGPADTNPETGEPYGLDFPLITIRDMVRAQAKLIERLGIDKLLAVIGGSMGGMQAQQWAVSYPDKMHAVAPVATAARQSAQNIAFHEVGRQAIMADPFWYGGGYQRYGTKPSKGLAVARMAAHITYLSEPALQRKFGRRLQDRQDVSFEFKPDFQVESYLHHQGTTFVDRFDANSYLYMTRATDYFDLAADHGGQLSDAFRACKARFLIVGFTSDWLYPPAENKRIALALNATGAQVSFVEIESDKGHDAFLLDEPQFFSAMRGFIGAVAADVGVK